MSFNRPRVWIVNAAVLLLASGMLVIAQGPGQGRGFGGPGGFGPGPRFGFGGGKVVTNEPYSATRVTTFTEVLNGGNTISRVSCTNVYRDNQGRTRQEETPNSATCGSSPAYILIRDPVAGVEYVVNGLNNTYRQLKFRTPPSTTTTPKPNRPAGPDSAEVQTTILPSKTISVTGTATSLTIDGTQTTRTIPAGQIGNAQPIVITTTIWRSPDLQVVASSERDDPRSGKAASQLSNIVLGEPSVSFQPPSNATLQQGPGGHFRPR